MADICLFYSKPDKNKVDTLSSIFEDLGWSVWWDDKLNNDRWAPEIEKEITLARCVIPIWNSNAKRNNSVTFPEADMARNLNKPMITLISENIVPPLPFNSEHITADISNWDCSTTAVCVNQIIKSVENKLGIAPQRWSGERPDKLNILGRQIKLPCLVKSLSSHETQLDPEAGLSVFGLFPNVDAILVSAYDMYLRIDDNAPDTEKKVAQDRHEWLHKKLNELNERDVFILLDSGNYEKARKKDNTWTEEKYFSVLENTKYTSTFCYDNLEPDRDIQKNVEDVIARIAGKYKDFILPILHAPLDDEGLRAHEMLPEIFLQYTRLKKSPIIAVPERELGEGICEKAKTIIEIRKKLSSLDYYQPIHILGTGNPLSILILAAAGADLFDGLEWCRTVADRNTGFLFHHQQFDFFKTQSLELARYEIVRDAMTEDDTSLTFKLALHNLDFFIEWMEDVQTFIHKNRVSEMIKYRMSFDTRGLVEEIKRIIPGLFN